MRLTSFITPSNALLLCWPDRASIRANTWKVAKLLYANMWVQMHTGLWQTSTKGFWRYSFIQHFVKKSSSTFIGARSNWAFSSSKLSYPTYIYMQQSHKNANKCARNKFNLSSNWLYNSLKTMFSVVTHYSSTSPSSTQYHKPSNDRLGRYPAKCHAVPRHNCTQYICVYEPCLLFRVSKNVCVVSKHTSTREGTNFLELYPGLLFGGLARREQ